MVIFQLFLRKFWIQTWFCNFQQYLCLFHIVIEYRLCSSGSSPAHPTGFRGTPWGDHLSTRRECQRTYSTGPSTSRNTFSVSTITDGNARIGGRSTFPALTLAWLYIDPSPCGGVRPAGDPVDSDPGAVFEDDPHPRSDAGRQPELWVCHHTREPTVLSRVSCRSFHLNVDRFHQPCLLFGRTSRNRWGLSSPYHVAATYPFWAARLFLLCVSLEVFATPTRRYHGRMLIHASRPACVISNTRGCLHTRRFGTLANPPLPVRGMPWGPSPWPRTSNMVNMLEESTLNHNIVLQWRINKIASWMSLKSSEIQV